MRLPFPRKNRRRRREHIALAGVGAAALNDWRTEHPGEPLRLDRANLANADLRAANLRDAQLARADLSHADLSGADLTDAILHGASLRYANLGGVCGLIPVQLAGCDLAGATLPDNVDPAVLAESAGLGESAAHTRHLFMWMAGMCAFCLLTLASMPCCQLLTSDGTVKLPVFSAQVRTSLFFIAAPVLLIGTFHYFHICLQRLWERLADLPAVFPDGQPLDRKTNGWIMLSLALGRPRASRGANPRRAMFRTQTVLNLALAYVMVPATVMAIWWRYAFRHDWNGSILHALAVAWTFHLAIGCYATATGALRGKKRRLLLWGRHVVAVSLLFFLQELMNDSFDGGGLELFNVHLKGEAVSPRPTSWTAARMDVVRRYTQTLPHRENPFAPNPTSTQPTLELAKYADQYQQAYAQVRGAELTGVNLAGAMVVDSHLVAAEMLGANLYKAQFLEADLSRAELGCAVLMNARFFGCWLVGAAFQQADLRFAELHDCVAFDARFNGANMSQVTTTLYADFRRADLTKAILTGAKLHRVLLAGARLDDAKLNPAILDGADLTGASLVGADLRGASLVGAMLADADFTNARLNGTSLRDADLTGCKGLTREQLAVAVLDVDAPLPAYLMDKSPEPESPPLAATPPPEVAPPVPPPAEKLVETGAAPAMVAEPAATELAPPVREDVAEVENPLRPRR